MIIGPQYVFCSTPKAATHTLFALLQKQFGGKHMCHVLGHAEYGYYHGRHVPQGFEKQFRFTSVRNPYSRAVSIWWCLANKEPYCNQYPAVMGGSEFKDFARWIAKHWRENVNNKDLNGTSMLMPQHEWHSVNKYDDILHVENMEAEFNALPFVKEHIEVPDDWSFKKDRKPAWEYYDQETADYIRDWEGRSFNDYGYALEGWKPIVEEKW